MPTDKRIFVNSQGGAWKGGMDKNSSERYIQNGHYSDARNVSFMVNGDRFILTNLKGNTEVSYTLRTGDNLCIGSRDDKNSETVYYFIWNGDNNHQIIKYEYNATVVAVTELAYGTGLNFEFDSLITGIDVVQSRYLVWTDNLNEIGCLDLDNYGTLTSPITASDRWEVELLKVNQEVALEPKFCSINSKARNALINDLYKFRLRYVYEGGFRTYASTISRLAIPTWSFLEDQVTGKDNAISIGIDLPAYDKVEKVEVLVQAGDTDDTMGDWYKFFEVSYDDINDNINDRVVVAYTGEQQLEALDQTEVVQPFSFIPKRSKEIVFLPSNVLAFGNNTEGFDADIIPHVQAYAQYQQQATGGATTTAVWNNTGTGVSGTFLNVNYDIKLDTSLNYKTLTIGGTPHVGDSITVAFTITVSGSVPLTPVAFTYQVQYIVKDNDTTATIAENFADAFNSGDTRDRGYGGVVAYVNSSVVRIVYGVNENQAPYTPSTAITASVSSVVVSTYMDLGTRTNFKRFATHNVAVQYEDAKGRRSGAIPAASFYVEGQDISNNNAQTTARVIIEHEPPADATRYNLLYSKNTTYESYLQKWCNMYLVATLSFDSGTGTLPLQGASLEVSALNTCVFLNQVSGDSDVGVIRVAITAGTFSTSDVVTYNTSAWTGTLLAGSTSTELLAFDIFDRIEYEQDTYGVQADEYNYVDGDRIKLLAVDNASTRTFLSEIPDLAIHSADNMYVYAEYDVSSLTPSITASPEPTLIELWRPKSKGDPILYYEIGYSFDISGGYHEGSVQNQSASQGAIITLKDVGDSYYMFSPNATGFADEKMTKESESLAFRHLSAVTGIGRSNVESDSADVEITRTTAVAYTQPIIPNSPTNGLSMALGSSISIYDAKFGSIQKMSLTNNKQLTVYFEDKVGDLGVLEELNKQASGSVVYQTSALLNGINYYSYDGGIGLSPESFAYYDKTQYFISPRNNAVCRLSNDGITEISNWGMTKWFNDNLDIKENLLTGVNAYGVFDERNQSYIISLSSYIELNIAIHPTSGILVTLPDGFVTAADYAIKVGESVIATTSTNGYVLEVSGVSRQTDDTAYVTWTGGTPAYVDVVDCTFISQTDTVWFSEDANAWLSFLDFIPEMMATCGVDYVSFKDGAMWLHNSNDTRGSFYGTAYDAEVTVPFNTPPDVQKRFETIEQESNSVWKSDTDGDIVTLSGQTSLLEAAFYTEFQQGEWAAALRKDSSSPNETYPLLNGYDLRDRVISFRLVNGDTTRATLEAVALSFSVSETSN